MQPLNLGKIIKTKQGLGFSCLEMPNMLPFQAVSCLAWVPPQNLCFVSKEANSSYRILLGMKNRKKS